MLDKKMSSEVDNLLKNTINSLWIVYDKLHGSVSEEVDTKIEDALSSVNEIQDTLNGRFDDEEED